MRKPELHKVEFYDLEEAIDYICSIYSLCPWKFLRDLISSFPLEYGEFNYFDGQEDEIFKKFHRAFGEEAVYKYGG